MLIMGGSVPCLCCQKLCLPDQALVIGDQHPSGRTSNDFVTIKRKYPESTKNSCVLPFVISAGRFSSIFNEWDVVLIASGHYRVNISALAIQMDDNYRLWPFPFPDSIPNCIFKAVAVHIPGAGFAVYEYRGCPLVGDRIRGRCKGQRGTHYFITRLDTQYN